MRTPGGHAATSRISVLARWKMRGGTRELARDATRTLQGRLMLALTAIAVPGLVSLAANGGPLAEADLDPASRLGALLTSEIALGVCYAIMVPIVLAQGLVPRRDRDVLRAHAGYLPEAAVLNALKASFGPALFLWTFFLLFDGRVLLAETRGVPLAASFVASGLVQFSVLGMVLAEAMRRLLRGPRGRRRGERLRRLGALPFLVSFPSFVWAPLVLERVASGSLAEVGGAGEKLLFFLQVPFGLGSALATHQRNGAALWIAGLALAAALASSLLARWLSMGAGQLAMVPAGTGTGRAYRAFPLPRRGPRAWRQLWLFWWKDVVLPVGRRPRSYLGLQGGLMSGTVLLAFAIRAIPPLTLATPDLELPLRPGAAELMMGATGALSMVMTLGSLGVEGRSLALLHPVVGTSRLLSLKWCVASIYVLAHVPLYSALIFGLGAAFGLDQPSIWVLLGLGVGLGPVFCLLGTALGFLMPDFQGRSPVLPGASRSSQMVFGASATLAVAASTLSRALGESGAIGGRGMVAFDAWAVLALIGISTALRGWAVRRFHRLEPAP